MRKDGRSIDNDGSVIINNRDHVVVSATRLMDLGSLRTLQFGFFGRAPLQVLARNVVGFGTISISSRAVLRMTIGLLRLSPSRNRWDRLRLGKVSGHNWELFRLDTLRRC
jgi:hypothetical protein